MSDNDVRDLKDKLDKVQNELSELKGQITSLTNTVGLLVDGKIKTSESNTGMAKVTMAALEIVRMAVAGFVGYFAGR